MHATLLAFAALLALAFFGCPLGFAMMMVGFVGFAILRGVGPALETVGHQIVDVSLSYGFSVLPLFVLMGAFIYHAALSRDLYNAANAWLGHHRGGLAMATIAACGGFSAVSGSSAATAATMAKVALPPMHDHGYADELAAGSVAAGGTLGILIPPSTGLVIYGLIAEQDIGKLFLAGILPGILTIALYIAVIAIATRIKPQSGPAGVRLPWRERVRALYRVWAVAALFVGILGGIYLGVFTPTEAGGIGAVGSLVFALGRRKLDFGQFVDALVETGKTTAMIFCVAFGALIISNLINISGLPEQLVAWIGGLDVSPLMVIFVICGIYLVLGCLIDGIGMILLTVPVFFPIVQALGFDLIWFGIVVIVVTEISQITPPVGINLFVLKTMMPKASLTAIVRGVVPFLVADMIRLLLIILFPAISLLVPSLM
jgi:tripartite ATP-independent transporter DctM subunit